MLTSPLILLSLSLSARSSQNAGNAIAALKASLTPRCTVKREGRWKNMDAGLLVPGDVINLKLGDIMPADCKLLEGGKNEIGHKWLLLPFFLVHKRNPKRNLT